MDARHLLNLTVHRITGQDVRHLGQWDPLPGLNDYASDLADAFGLSESQLRRCREVGECLALIESNARPARPSEDQPAMF